MLYESRSFELRLLEFPSFNPQPLESVTLVAKIQLIGIKNEVKIQEVFIQFLFGF